MRRSFAQHARLVFDGSIAVAVLMLLVCGLVWIAGEGRAVNLGYWLAGAGMLLAALTIMTRTVRRWAKYFVGVCLLASAHAVFALLAGHTLSQPRLITNRPLVSAILAILVGLIFFSARFTANAPRTKLDSVALVGAVVGVVGTMLTEPGIWPLLGALTLLGTAWVLNQRRQHQPRATPSL